MIRRYNILYSQKLWQGTGEGNIYSTNINDDFHNILKINVDEVMQVRQEKRTNKSRITVIQSLSERGLHFINNLTSIDENDLVGLLGEMITNDFHLFSFT